MRDACDWLWFSLAMRGSCGVRMLQNRAPSSRWAPSGAALELLWARLGALSWFQRGEVGEMLREEPTAAKEIRRR